MAKLKNITDLPVAESAEGLNLIVNDNGAAKQIAANVVGKVKSVNGAQPDEHGNVEIDTTSSWNDLKDKPFCDNREYYTICEDYELFGDDDRNWAEFTVPRGFVEGETVTVVFSKPRFTNEKVTFTDVATQRPWGDDIACIIPALDAEDNPEVDSYMSCACWNKNGEIKVYVSSGKYREASIYIVTGELKQIEPKYVPTTSVFDLVIKYDEKKGSVKHVSPEAYSMIMNKIYRQEPVLIWIAVQNEEFSEGFIASMIEPYQKYNTTPWTEKIRIVWYDDEYDYCVDLMPDGSIEYYGEY